MKIYFALITMFVNFTTANAFTSSFQVELFSGININEGRTSGHEEITRQALIKTKELLKLNESKVDISKAGVKLLKDLDFTARGVIGALAVNPIIKGVYCSDFPETRQCVFSLSEFWFRDQPGVDWHTGNNTQSLHFLRNYRERGGLVSPRRACYQARERIITASITAAREWQSGKIENALFLLGHAAHIIQDSFSHAHVRRDNVMTGFKIKDVCYYGDDKKQELLVYNKDSMACFHPSMTSTNFEEAIYGDSIWLRTEAQVKSTTMNYRGEPIESCPMMTNHYILSPERKVSCLNLEARIARDATVKYLYLMADEFYKHRHVAYTPAELGKLTKHLNDNFFDGSIQINNFTDRLPNGVAQCGHLSDQAL